jgi:hypothetical protein
MKKYILISLLCMASGFVHAQADIDDDQLGAWYMYFFTKKFKDSQFGIQGDFQYRNWNLGGDLEQLLLRTGLTYQPKDTNVTFTLGYAFVSSGEFGESDRTSLEHRIYQEALLPQKIGGRFFLTHRFRYEQRWVENQDFRTRYRYALFMNVPLNGKELKQGIVYLALYNEIFINGQTDIGNDRSVQLFDRNRFYMGMGYGLKNNLRIQLGIMNQATVAFAKPQLQVGIHHNF